LRIYEKMFQKYFPITYIYKRGVDIPVDFQFIRLPKDFFQFGLTTLKFLQFYFYHLKKIFNALPGVED